MIPKIIWYRKIEEEGTDGTAEETRWGMIGRKVIVGFTIFS